AVARHASRLMLEPLKTTFILLSFEGPDIYSQAGGLGVRVKELSRALAERGYETHLFFVGDPNLPADETMPDGRLSLHRWSQWLSRYHPVGVTAEEVERANAGDPAPDHVLPRRLHQEKEQKSADPNPRHVASPHSQLRHNRH